MASCRKDDGILLAISYTLITATANIYCYEMGPRRWEEKERTAKEDLAKHLPRRS